MYMYMYVYLIRKYLNFGVYIKYAGVYVLYLPYNE